MDNENIANSTSSNLNSVPPIEPKQAPTPEKPRRVRRVGTITMGLSLIAVGLALCATLIYPIKDVLIIAKFSPLILVFIGIEIIVAAARNDGSKIKYDFLSFVMCILLIFGALGATLIPYVYEYAGPDRHIAESNIEADITNALLERQSEFPSVYKITSNVSLTGIRKFDGTETRKDLINGDWVSVYAEFSGSYESAEAFAADVLPLFNAVRGLTGSYIQLGARSSARGNNKYFEIDLGRGSYAHISPQSLAESVTEYTYNEKYGSYLSQDSYAEFESRIENYETMLENNETQYNETISQLEQQIVDLQTEINEVLEKAGQDADVAQSEYQSEIEKLQEEKNNLREDLDNALAALSP